MDRLVCLKGISYLTPHWAKNTYRHDFLKWLLIVSFKSMRGALITGVITTSTDHRGAGLLMTHEASAIYNNMTHILPLFFCPKPYMSWHYGWIFGVWVNNPKFGIRFAMLVDLTEFFSVGSCSESHGSYIGINRRDVHKAKSKEQPLLAWMESFPWCDSNSLLLHCTSG